MRRFEIALGPQPKAIIVLSAKIVDPDGHLKAAQLFEEARTIDTLAPANAATPAGWSVRISISKVPNLAPSSASEEAQSDGQRTSRVLDPDRFWRRAAIDMCQARTDGRCKATSVTTKPNGG